MSSFSSGLFFCQFLHTGTHDTEVFQGFSSLLFPHAAGALALMATSCLRQNVFDVGFLEIHSMFETIQKDFGLQEYGSRQPENTFIIKHLWVYKIKNIF